MRQTLSLEDLRASVRDFADREVAPMAADLDRDDAFPRHLWPKLGDLAVLGPTVAEADGGLGLGPLEHLVLVEELSRASAAIGMSYAAHSNLCVHNLWRHATDGQRDRWLPRLLAGEHVGALAMSEADAGSDVLGSMRCAATRVDGGWRATGTKMWITNGPDADVLLVYMRTGGADEPAARAITAFVIERGMDGFTTSPKLDKLGMRGSGTCELVFEDCFIPEDQVLGEPGGGAAILMAGLESERLVLTGGPIGIMQAALDLVLPYVREREQFGKPIGSFQLMQAKLADMHVALEASRAYAYRVAAAFDPDGRQPEATAGCLLFASERAVGVALEAIQAFGGMGYVNENASGRLLRDAKLYTIGAGTNEIRRMLIGRTLTGKLA